MRTFLSWLIGLPVAVVIVVFALSNRQEVTVALWPFEEGAALPVFLVVLLCLAAGVVAGLLAGGMGILRHRRRARAMERRNAELEREVERLRPPPEPATPPNPNASPGP